MLISRYLSPSAERERTIIVESTGIGSTSRSSLRSRRALRLPSASCSGSIASTAPTRTPPTRTSLPGTRVSALGTWTEIR